MLIYSQRSGEMRRFEAGQLIALGGSLIGIGYAGKGEGKNNPLMQNVRNVGPIPRGFWRIGSPYDSKNTGPYTIPLYKLDDRPGDDVDGVSGRSAFRIHGDSSVRPGQASEGCIILPRSSRVAVTDSRSEILWIVE